jgi:hypothetical protein
VPFGKRGLEQIWQSRAALFAAHREQGAARRRAGGRSVRRPPRGPYFHTRVDHLPPVTSTSIDQVVRGFVPTRRFAHVTFESYHPDPRFPSQAAARDRVRDFAAYIGQQRRAHLLSRLVRNTSEGRRAIYLIFAVSYRHGGYEKKYRRCLSRLHELVSETKAATPPAPRDTGRDTPLARGPAGLREDPTRAD